MAGDSKGLVLDASVALAWLFKDERTRRTTEILRRVVGEGAVVPAIWHYEISSGLQLGVRRKRLTPEVAHDRMRLFLRLQLEVDPHVPARFPSVLTIAEENSVTVYDAAYVELALRRALPLATNDTELAKAARRKKVITL